MQMPCIPFVWHIQLVVSTFPNPLEHARPLLAELLCFHEVLVTCAFLPFWPPASLPHNVLRCSDQGVQNPLLEQWWVPASLGQQPISELLVRLQLTRGSMVTAVVYKEPKSHESLMLVS